jgi:hypothetical protein
MYKEKNYEVGQQLEAHTKSDYQINISAAHAALATFEMPDEKVTISGSLAHTTPKIRPLKDPFKPDGQLEDYVLHHVSALPSRQLAEKYGDEQDMVNDFNKSAISQLYNIAEFYRYYHDSPTVNERIKTEKSHTNERIFSSFVGLVAIVGSGSYLTYKGAADMNSEEISYPVIFGMATYCTYAFSSFRKAMIARYKENKQDIKDEYVEMIDKYAAMFKVIVPKD